MSTLVAVTFQKGGSIYLNGVSMDRCQLLWLLHSKKVVGYYVEIPFPDTWILKEGEVLQMKVAEVTQSIVEI